MGILLGVRKLTLWILLLWLLGARMPAAETTAGLESYLGVPRYDRPRWDPEGRRLAFLTQQQLYLREPTGESRPLNRKLYPISSYFWTADGRSLIVEAGRESRSRVYRVDASDGSSEPLTPSGVSCRHPVLGPGQLLACTRDDTSIVLIPLATRTVRVLYTGKSRLGQLRFSPDGKTLLAIAERGNADQDLLAIELASGQARTLTRGVRLSDLRWRGNDRVQALTDRGRERMELAQLDLASGQWSTLASGSGDVEGFAWGPDGQLAYTVNELGASRLYLRSGKARPRLVSIPSGVVKSLGYRKDGKLTFWLSGPRQPGSAWLLDQGAARLVLGPSVGHLELAVPHRVRLPGDLPALLYTGPPGSPAVILLHGGPANQSRPEFSPLLQYLASQGYTLLLPDYRGSLGYGRSYLAADDGNRRGVAVDDVLSSARWLAEHGHDRIAVAGFSYGGFLALAAVAREPDTFRGVVSLSGISDLASFVQSQPGRREMRQGEFGDPDLDASVLAELSPLHQVPRLRRPVLVLHGDQDERVPIADALKFVAELRKTGTAVEFVRLGGEGHGLNSAASRQAGYQAMVDFLARVTRP